MPVTVLKNKPKLPCVLGVDPSTKTGLVVMDKQAKVLHKEEYYAGKVEKGDAAGRIKRALEYGKKAKFLIELYQPSMLVIEGYAFMASGNLSMLIEIGSAIRFYAVNCGTKFVEVAPTALKKFVTGTGNCKKDLMLLQTYKRWHFETESDNVCDAYGLARIGLCMIGVPAVNAAERAVIANLKSGAED